MLMYKTIAKIFFGESGPIIMQNLSDILPLLSTQTRPSQKVSEKQEYSQLVWPVQLTAFLEM